MVVTLGQQYHVGEKTTFILLYTYIDRHAGTPNKTKTKYTMSLDYSSIYNIGFRIDRMGVDEGNLLSNIIMVMYVERYSNSVLSDESLFISKYKQTGRPEHRVGVLSRLLSQERPAMPVFALVSA